MGLTNMTGGLDLGSRASVFGDYGCLCGEYPVASKFDPSSFAVLLPLLIRGVDIMSKTSILELCEGASVSTLFSNNTRIGKMEWQISSKISEADEAVAELESFKRGICFVKHNASPMWDQVQSQGPKHREVKVKRVASKLSPAAVESYVLLLTVVKLALPGEAIQ